MYVLAGQMIENTFNVANSVSVSVTHGVDSIGLSDQVMETYRSLGKEERSRVGTPEYRAAFSRLEETEDYDVLYHMLRSFLEKNEGVFDVYVAMYDRETGAPVYFADPDTDPATRCLPGDWGQSKARRSSAS